MFFEEAREMSIFKKLFSKILEKVGRRLISLYKTGYCGCL
jgi:hypothetical protein